MSSPARCAVTVVSALALALLLVSATAPASPIPTSHAPLAPDTATLRQALERLTAGHDGVVGISVRDLGTGSSVSLRGNETFPSASLIKIAVLVTLLDEVAEGRAALDERVTMVARDRVGGSGVLHHMASGTTLTLEDLAWLMITISDNTATNLILDKIDIRPVWDKMERLGLPHTKIHSKTFRRETSIAMDSSVVYGLGVTTPDETVQLLTMLHEGRAVSPGMDSLALRMLMANQDGQLLRRLLPPDVRVANKSGAVSQARNDCGILYTPATPVAVCVMTRENADTSFGVDNAAYRLAGEIARTVHDHFNR